jgi:16S rRNA (guanine966-N2)-methyltransferase
MKRGSGRLRIIGGEWRSRIVEFAADPAVRATPDRVRQTVFDWLAPIIDGARCLDLFAGSGALGLEALSRGAAQVTFVERAPLQLENIGRALQLFGATQRAEVLAGDALQVLAQLTQRYDIAFVDPPYDSGLLEPALTALSGRLTAGARVYVEWRKGTSPAFPEGYRLLKEKAAGQVSYGLLSRDAGHRGNA